MLLNSLLATLVVLAVLGLWACLVERRWGVFVFSLVMFSAMGALMIYGAAHTSDG